MIMDAKEIVKELKDWCESSTNNRRYFLITLDGETDVNILYNSNVHDKLPTKSANIASLLLMAMFRDEGIAGAIDLLADKRGLIISKLESKCK